MSKPVILLDAGELVALPGANAGDVLTWSGTEWQSSPGGGTGTVTSVTAGAGLAGGVITTSGTISMPDVGAAGSYGSASSVAVITTDEQGRVSAATTTAIAITQSQVADLVTDLGNKADKSVTATAGTGLTGGGTLGANFSFALDTVGTAQTNLGSASKTVTISTDAYGRVTALSEQSIGSLPASAISTGQLALAQGGTGIDASGVTGGQILVGGTGVLALQSISGDATLVSTGAVAVTKLQGNAVSATALGAPDAGKALVWSGSEWQASTIQGGGGGGGLTFFMNYAASSPYPMSPQFDENAGWDTGAITVANDANGTALGTFVTAVGSPAIEVIPAGLWDVNFYAQSSAGVNSTAVRVKIATLAGVTQTVIATSDWVYLSDPSAIVQYSASVYVPATDVALTDRVEIIFEGRRFVSPSQTITLHFGTDSITHAHTTINAPGGTGLVKVVDGFLQSPAALLLNADVDAAAAIAVSKLAAGTNDYVLTTVAGVPTWSAVASSGVTSLTGTTDQVNVSAATGNVTLSLPQSIASTSSPTFAGLTVGSLSGLLRATAGVLAGGATVALGSEVSGTLPVGNGGTGLTAVGASGNLLVSDGSALASVAMSGDATIASTGAMTLKNTGTAGTYGSASAVPVITTDAQGRVTSATNTNIAISASAITSGVLGAANGGTGVSSLTTNALLVGGATVGGLTGTAAGQVATWNGTAWTAAAPTSGGTVTSVSTVTTGVGLTMVVTNPTSTPTITLAGTLNVASGGTGATTAAGARTNLGLGTMATQSASDYLTTAAATSTFMPLAGGTFSGKVTFPSATTSASSVNVPAGTAPTSPVNGDIWTTTTGIFARVNGVSVQLAAYDVPLNVAGTPTGNAELMQLIAVRPFLVPTTGHQAGCLGLPVTGTPVFTVWQALTGLPSATRTPIGTITIGTDGAVTLSFASATSFAIGNVLGISAPADLYGINSPFFTIKAFATG